MTFERCDGDAWRACAWQDLRKDDVFRFKGEATAMRILTKPYCRNGRWYADVEVDLLVGYKGGLARVMLSK